MPPSWKALARTAAQTAGLFRLVRRRRRGQLRILMYHRFAGAQALERLELQCRHLAKHYDLVTFSEGARMLAGEIPLPPYPLAVTVDDGYADFAPAWPVFRSQGIRPMVYLTTGFIDRSCWLWVDVMEDLFTRAGRVRAEVRPGVFVQTAGECKRLAKTLPDAERRALLDRLPHLLGVDPAAELSGSCHPLTWEQIRQLAAGGVEFGAHTLTHPILSQISDPALLASEIAGSGRRLAEMVQMPVRHFCYPNGTAADLSAAAEAAIRTAGFFTAVTTERGGNRPGDNLFRLRRVGVTPEMEFASFQMEAAGYKTAL